MNEIEVREDVVCKVCKSKIENIGSMTTPWGEEIPMMRCNCTCMGRMSKEDMFRLLMGDPNAKYEESKRDE